MVVLKKIFNLIVLGLLLIIQVALAGHLQLYGISMDIVLVALVALTLKEGLYYGLFYGFFAGMVLDLLTQHIVGASALLYALGAWIVFKMIESGFRKVLSTYFLTVFLVTEFHLIIFNLIYYLFNFNINMAAFSLEILIRPAINVLLIFLIFPLIGVAIPGEDHFEYKYKKKA